MRRPLLVRPATALDNDALLRLMRRAPMEGSAGVVTEREPDFFALNRLQGDDWTVIVAEDERGAIVGCLSATIREVYVDGVPTRCFYVGDLRVSPERRRSNIVAQLGWFLMDEALPADVELGCMSIMEGNRAARMLLRNHRILPAVIRPVGRVSVYLVPLLLPRRRPRAGSVRPAQRGDLGAIVRLLNDFNARHTFAPVWSVERLERRLAPWTGLTQESFKVVERGGRIVGVLAAWDQSGFQRSRILSYPTPMAAYARFHNAAAPLLRLPRLPRPGELLRQVYVTHLAIENDDPAVFRALLGEVYREQRRRGYHCLMFGLAEDHPLLGALDGFVAKRLASTVCTVIRRGSRWTEHDLSVRTVAHEVSHT